MKKIFLYEKANVGSDKLVGRYNTVEEAQNRVIELTEDSEKSIFDFYPQEGEYEEITDRVKSYADACNVLGIEPMNEDNMKAQGFRPDEIARRKLEAITEALNEGWKPDWNNTDECKYYPYFYINENARGKGNAGLSCANTITRLRLRMRASALGFASTTTKRHVTPDARLPLYTNKF